jgi:hypothetical protein
MNQDDPIKTAANTIGLIGEVIKAAGDNPHLKEAANNLAKTAVTITKTINNVLLPIAAVNFGFDKAREYFEKKFEKDMSEKVSAIPPDQIVNPKPSIAGPALQGLAFAHEEVNLKEMYLNLLATAMDARVTEKAHPAFVEIIRQLTSDEANLIRWILRYDKPTAIVEVRRLTPDFLGSHQLIRHMMPMIDTTTGAPREFPRFASMVDNWIRLGLVEVDYQHHLMDSDAYAWIDQRPEIKRYLELEGSEGRFLEYRKGIIQRTSLGLEFAKTVGLLD